MNKNELVQTVLSVVSVLIAAGILGAVRAIARNTAQVKENTNAVNNLSRDFNKQTAEDGKLHDRLENDVQSLKDWRLTHESAHTTASSHGSHIE